MFGGGSKPIGGGALAPQGPYGSYGPGFKTLRRKSSTERIHYSLGTTKILSTDAELAATYKYLQSKIAGD